jgi:hypothetical protein
MNIMPEKSPQINIMDCRCGSFACGKGLRWGQAGGREMDVKGPELQKLMDEILSRMKEKRKQLPKATFTEIERETMKRTTELHSRLMEDLAQGSEVGDWAQGEALTCP